MLTSTSEFLQALYAPYAGSGLAELRVLVPKPLRDKETGTVVHKAFYPATPAGLSSLQQMVDRHSGKFECYHSYLPRFEAQGDGRSVNRAAWLYCSVDDAENGRGGTTDGTAAELITDRIARGVIPNPQITVASGHGIHAYWKLPDVLDLSSESAHTQYEEVMARLARAVGGKAPGAHSDPSYLNSLPRTPGSLNHKHPAVPRPVTITRFESRHSWSYRVWLTHLPQIPKRSEPIYAGVGCMDAFPPGIERYLHGPVGEGGRHHALTKLLVALRKGCFGDAVLADAGQRFCALNDYPVKEMLGAIRWAKRNVPPVPNQGRIR